MNVVLSGILLLVTCSVQAQFTETREFVKRYKLSAEARIDITNKYGKIELNTWKKDSVVIRFKMEVNEKKPDRLKSTLAGLDFDITNNQHYLIVKTQLDNNRSQLENEFLKFKETMLQTSGSIRIDLTVWLPDNRDLRLENKFGDIVLNDYSGETELILSNGKLKCGDLSKKSILNLNFADATINSLPNARISSNYSDIHIRNAGTLRIDSKSSTIEIQNSNELNIDSRRDKFRIRLADKIDATGNFSKFDIAELKGKAILRLSYGSLDFDKIRTEFSSIYIDARSTDVNLYFDPEAKFNFQITETKTDLGLGREFKTENREVLDPKVSKVRHTGYLGKKMKDDQLIINAVGGETNLLTN